MSAWIVVQSGVRAMGEAGYDCQWIDQYEINWSCKIVIVR
jgi:hypothetical protein